MRIKPIEKKSHTDLLKGIVVIGALVILGLVYNKYRANIKINPKVLGEAAIKKIVPVKTIQQMFADDSKKIFDYASSTADSTKNIIVGEVKNIIDDTASRAADTATDVIFTNTVGNLLKQIDKLPQRQQEDIRKQICK